MLINGSGISPAFSAKIKPDFQVQTTLALKWAQASNGNWYAIDRTAVADDYACVVNLYSKEAADAQFMGINDFIAILENNRETTTGTPNILALSDFALNEHIFGEDVDYSGTINATYDPSAAVRRSQGSIKGWGYSGLRLVAQPTLSFVGAAVLPGLRFIDVGVDADRDGTINKNFTYNRVVSTADHRSDAGRFVCTLTLTALEMRMLRRYRATVRGSAFTMPVLPGIAFPFGSEAGAFPKSVQLIDWQGEQMISPDRWSVQISISEVF